MNRMGAAVEQVPFVDLRRQHNSIRADLDAAYGRVVDASAFTLGSEVAAFEAAFADYVGASHAIGVASGTDALHLALRAQGIGPGDEVITAVNTFAATVEAIIMAGARPVLADIDEYYLIDVSHAASLITPRTRAIIPVHLYGQPADMLAVNELAARYGLFVLEDACQAHGSTRDGGRAGSLGDAAAFSFYPGKNLGALGDGGIVTTDDDVLADRIRLLRAHGENAERLHVESGYCSRLHGLQAAFLSAKLPHLDSWNEMRAFVARQYDKGLFDSAVVTPQLAPGATHVYHLYVVSVRRPRCLPGGTVRARRSDCSPLCRPASPRAGVRAPRISTRRLSRRRAGRADNRVAAGLPVPDLGRGRPRGRGNRGGRRCMR